MEAAGGTSFVTFESKAEIAFSITKVKFEGSLRSKSDVRQINEALCKVLCNNLCVLVQTMQELGI